MTKPDVIVSWPRNCDYPLWRQFIREERKRFNKVIIAFTETNQGHDYRWFVRDAMAEDIVEFIDPTVIPPGGDWRNEAVNWALKRSDSEWIWFTEQDFTPLTGFFEEVERLSPQVEVIGVLDGSRLHPCSLFITRKALEETRRDFGIDPGKLDHFGKIQEDLASHRIGIVMPHLYMHMAGLSHNYRLMESGDIIVHKPVEFVSYLHRCLGAKVPIDDYFRDQVSLYMEWKKVSF